MEGYRELNPIMYVSKEFGIEIETIENPKIEGSFGFLITDPRTGNNIMVPLKVLYEALALLT